MQTSCHLRVLRAEAGAELRNVLDDGPERFNGRPGFLLEPDATECLPFGTTALRESERGAQLPAAPLSYCREPREDSFTELAVALALPLAAACRDLPSLAVLCAHSCLSEDVSTCLTSRVIETLGLAARHSLTVLGEPGAAWAQAIECAQALQHGEGAASSTLLLAGEKWRAPFRRHFGDLFVLADGMAAVLVGAHAPSDGPGLVVAGCATTGSNREAPWLHTPVRVDALAWAAGVEAGLQRLEARLDLDLRAGSAAVLGPVLGVTAADLRSVAPRLAVLVEASSCQPAAAAPGHFGAADPFLRLQAWLRDDPAATPGAPVLVWSAGPGGEVSVLHGVACA